MPATPIIPTFADIANLIAPNHQELWLPAHLEWWAQGVWHDRLFDDCRPTRERARERLAAVAAAAALLDRELDDPVVQSLLLDANPTSKFPVSSWEMRQLVSQAEFSYSSPLLDAGDGKAKRGRGKPKLPGIFDARTLLAARILEMWRFFRKNVPGIGNLEAAAAADAYWLACGGERKGYGNPLNGWFDYFKAVRDNSGSIGLKQLIWRRDLEQAMRRGGPPWYEGTYFPIQSIEIKSPVPIE